MNAIRVILFIQVFVAFFVAGGVFFKSISLKNTTLAFLLLLMGAHIFLFLYGSGALAILYPEFRSWFYYEIAFLLGPTLVIHIQSVCLKKRQILWTDFLHLIPIFIFWWDYHDVLFMDASERDNYISLHFIDRTMFWNYLMAFQMIIYGLIGIGIVYVHRNVIQQNGLYHILFIVIAYLTSTALIVYLTHYASGWRDFDIYYLVHTVFIFGIGYLHYTKPKFFVQIRRKYFGSSLDKSEMKAIGIKINEALKEQHICLDNNLTIDTLANAINEKPHHVSQTFSVYLKEGFNDYINRQRIGEAQKLLMDSDYQNFKIEAIANKCGFNNKVTFYKAFSKFTHQTPSKFRKAQKRKQ